MSYLFPHWMSSGSVRSQSPACLEKFSLTVFGYRPKNGNSELGIFFKILFLKFRICLRQIFHNLLIGNNLEVDRSIIRKIPSYRFYVKCRKQ